MTVDNTKLGLRQNWKAFSILVLINALVGSLLGLERSVLPIVANEEFNLNGYTILLTFILSFGFFKAVFNFFAGNWISRFGRKRILVLGWILAIPIPFLLINPPFWSWVILANIFLGMNQGLVWSTAVIMKIDLVGKKRRGFAMGINEFSGYLSVAIGAFISYWIYTNNSIAFSPFYIGFFIIGLGLILSLVFVHETTSFVEIEASQSDLVLFENVFTAVTYNNPKLRRITIAGVINNLNDGLLWGILPVLFMLQSFSGFEAAWLIAIYPATWGVFQLFTGMLADSYSKKNLIFIGMTMQALALILYVFPGTLAYFLLCGVLMGIGTALVYPVFLVSIAENLHPAQRAKGLGAFRFWRDMGYVFGAFTCGVLLDNFNFEVAFVLIAGITFLSGLYAIIGGQSTGN